ncbi:MAG: hypothetical protein R3D67_15430 [Hyphomicrobiaceae bacterium]
MLDTVVNFFLVNATIVLPALVVLALIVSSTARRALKAVLRMLAWPLLIAAVIALVYDGTKTMAAGSGIVMTTVEQHWAHFAPKTLATSKALVVTKLAPVVWTGGIERLLKLPAWLVLGLLGLLLTWFGKRRRKVAIFTN